jgi:hypothetical protein
MSKPKTAVVNARVPIEVYLSVKQFAEEENKTVSEWLNPIIKRSVKFRNINKKSKGNGD